MSQQPLKKSSFPRDASQCSLMKPSGSNVTKTLPVCIDNYGAKSDELDNDGSLEEQTAAVAEKLAEALLANSTVVDTSLQVSH